MLGSLGIPTVMLSGDTTTVAEARRFLGPEAELVAVKEARGSSAAICRPLLEARADITAGVERSMAKTGRIPPYQPEGPFEIAVDLQTMAQCARASRIAGVQQIGPRTIQMAGRNPWEQYRVLWEALRAGLCEPSGWLA